MPVDKFGNFTDYPDWYPDPFSYSWNFDPSVDTGNPYSFEQHFRDQKANSPYGDLSTNAWNLYLSERQNYLNMAQWQAQNAFNLDMWSLNNAYNSPEQQIDRLVKAGINPSMNLSSAPSGNAQALKSDSPNAYNPIGSTGIDAQLAQQYEQFVQSNSLNATLGLGKLNIEQQKADIAAKVGDTEAIRNQKQADYLSSLAEGKRLSNKWDLASFDVRLDEESQKLQVLEAQIDELKSRKDLNEEQINELKALEDKYSAESDLASERINEIKASIRQRDEQIRVNWYNAHSNRISANASKSQADTYKGMSELQENRLRAEVQKWNNDQLLEYMRNFGRHFEVKGKGRLGFGKNYVEGSGSWSGSMPASDMPLKPIVVCNEIIDRASTNPSSKSLEYAAEADRLMRALSKVYNITPVAPQEFVMPNDATSVGNPVFGVDDQFNW